MYFDYLRETPWHPTFKWVKTSLEAADKINSYHEDYPKYVEATHSVLDSITDFVSQAIVGSFLQTIHREIFADKSFAGKWRDVNVLVGMHHPPQNLAVEGLMEELEILYNILDLKTLIEWYKDFETIHPFQDGNGRVGGVVVSAWSRNLYPQKGWLAPNQ